MEDGCLVGGMGSAILEFMADNQYNAHVIRLGIPDRLVEHGEQSELYAECGYDAKAIISTINNLIKEKKGSSQVIAS